MHLLSISGCAGSAAKVEIQTLLCSDTPAPKRSYCTTFSTAELSPYGTEGMMTM